MSLVNNPVNLISNTNQGSSADFMLNGTIHVTQASNVINGVVQGVSFTLQAKTTGTVTLSLSSDATQLSNALQTFVQNYNALVDQVDQQVGQSAGYLGGDMIIRDIMDDMRQLGGYWSNGSSVRSLSDVGVTFDVTGHLSFDQNVFNSLSQSQVTDAFKFFSSNSGFGSIANSFHQLTDLTSGEFIVEENGLDAANTQLSNQIGTLNDRISRLQTSLSAQLEAADAIIAALQQEQNTIDASIQSVNYVNFGRTVNNGVSGR